MNLKSIVRQALTGPVLLIGFLIGVLATLMIGLQRNLEHAEESLRPALSVVVFLQNSATDAEAKTWVENLQKQDHEVLSYTLVTKEEAFKTASQDPGLSKSMLLLKDNPLPTTITLRYSDEAWLNRPDPSTALKDPIVQEVRWDPRAQELFRTLHQWQNACRRLTIGVSVIVGLWMFAGLYRFLRFRMSGLDFVVYVAVGMLGAGLSLILWITGIRAFLPAAAMMHGAQSIMLPILLGGAAAIGCFGLETRDEE